MILGYIDPGQGMLIWQAIVSAFVGILFYLKKTRQFIAGIFLRIFSRRPSTTANNTPEPDLAAVKVEAKVEAR